MTKRQLSTRQSFLTGLIGAPIAHSASPALHEQAAEALGVRCHYQLIEIAGCEDVFADLAVQKAAKDRIAATAARLPRLTTEATA